MSVLDLPRIHFAGSCVLHQPTGNNNAEGNIDFTRNVIYRDGARVDATQDVREFYAWFQQLGQRFDARGEPARDGVFGSAAGRDYAGNSRLLWNATVTGCQLAFGSSCADPLLGRRVDLWGHYNAYIGTTFNQPKVVELDPTSSWTRQVYGVQLALGRGDSSTREPYLLNGTTTAIQSARLHKERHYGELGRAFGSRDVGRADLFHAAIPRESLITLDNRIGSPVLAALQRALDEDASITGLAFQYVLFNASSPSTPDTPTLCSLVGTLAPWREERELASFPAGRVLIPVRAVGDAARAEASAHRGPMIVLAHPRGLSCSALLALPFEGRSAQPRAGGVHAPGEPALDEPLYFCVRGQAEPLACLEPHALRAGDFLARGGIVDLPYAQGRAPGLAEHDLYVAARRGGAWLELYTERTPVVEAELGAAYLDIPNLDEGLTFDLQVELRSFVRGQPAPCDGITLRSVPNPRLHAHVAAPPAAHELGPRLLFRGAQGGDFTQELSLTTCAEGRARFDLRATRSGSARLLFETERDRARLASAHTLDPRERYDDDDLLGLWAELGALHVRVLPNDWHVYRQPDESVDFAFLYEHVLQFYELLYPFMHQEVFSLASGPKCRAHAVLNWQMCDPSQRDKSYYMPPTRELSYPKAMLFRKFVENSARIGRLPARTGGSHASR